MTSSGTDESAFVMLTPGSPEQEKDSAGSLMVWIYCARCVPAGPTVPLYNDELDRSTRCHGCGRTEDEA